MSVHESTHRTVGTKTGGIPARTVLRKLVAMPVGLVGGGAFLLALLATSHAEPQAAGTGITLHSVSVSLPDGDRSFPGGAAADAINNNCLACHSAGMVLTQPHLSRAQW